MATHKIQTGIHFTEVLLIITYIYRKEKSPFAEQQLEYIIQKCIEAYKEKRGDYCA